MTGYGTPIASFIEDRLAQPFETPADLHADIGSALLENHGFAAYEYEERYIKIHFPTRLCPECDDVRQLRVAVNIDTVTRRRSCPDCGDLGEDRHVAPEVDEIMLEYWLELDLLEVNASE